MAMTKINIICLQRMGIPTIQYVEFDDESQFEKGKAYVIGILKLGELKYERLCTFVTSSIDYVNELRRIYGIDSRILFFESAPTEVCYLFTIENVGQYSLDIGYASIGDKNEIESWFHKIERDYDFRNPINGVISRNKEGKLFISSIT